MLTSLAPSYFGNITTYKKVLAPQVRRNLPDSGSTSPGARIRQPLRILLSSFLGFRAYHSFTQTLNYRTWNTGQPTAIFGFGLQKPSSGKKQNISITDNSPLPSSSASANISKAISVTPIFVRFIAFTCASVKIYKNLINIVFWLIKINKVVSCNDSLAQR